ncbi:MAG: phosphate signaling complex protein PhoU [Acidobacteriota bacterium]|nr:phosphate signaling complex protein PhoU [Acidobacteriota bacterium]
MKEHFAEQLERVRRDLIVMGGEVEKQIRAAVAAVMESSTEMARNVIARDHDIDELENRIEEAVIHLFALQQPVAVDLRLLIGVLKINNDLERIGDHAVNIAEGAERLATLRTAKPNVDVRHMSDIAMSMLSDALGSFINRDAALARDVIRRDDTLDARNESLIRELLTYMAETPSMISRGLELISISKNLERVGDLATNIAEDTIFIAEARQVKHHAL